MGDSIIHHWCCSSSQAIRQPYIHHLKYHFFTHDYTGSEPLSKSTATLIGDSEPGKPSGFWWGAPHGTGSNPNFTCLAQQFTTIQSGRCDWSGSSRYLVHLSTGYVASTFNAI